VQPRYAPGGTDDEYQEGPYEWRRETCPIHLHLQAVDQREWKKSARGWSCYFPKLVFFFFFFHGDKEELQSASFQ
jgi:hypothetical protein